MQRSARSQAEHLKLMSRKPTDNNTHKGGYSGSNSMTMLNLETARNDRQEPMFPREEYDGVIADQSQLSHASSQAAAKELYEARMREMKL